MASPKFRPWWILWVQVCPWLILAPKVLKLCTNQLIVLFVQICVSDYMLVILRSPILEFQHTHVPPKCYKIGNVPRFFVLPLFSFQTYIWVYQGAWECVKPVVLSSWLSDYVDSYKVVIVYPEVDVPPGVSKTTWVKLHGTSFPPTLRVNYRVLKIGKCIWSGCHVIASPSLQVD